jgi:hypothetical protein
MSSKLILLLKCHQFKIHSYAGGPGYHEPLDPATTNLYVTLSFNNKQMKTKEAPLSNNQITIWSEEFKLRITDVNNRINGKIWAVDTASLEE